MSKILNEQETRQKMFQLAKSLGCTIELKRIFERYDPLLKRTNDETEKKQIAIMANAELHKLFSFRNALVVNGEEIIPADSNYNEEESIKKILGS